MVMTPTHAQLAERCAEVLALSDKATPGPWDTEAVFGERHWDVVLNYPTPIEGSPVVVASTYGEDGRMPSEEGASYNARFIAAAPRMAQCIRDLQEALREAEKGWQPIATAPKDGTRILARHCENLRGGGRAGRVVGSRSNAGLWCRLPSRDLRRRRPWLHDQLE